MQQQSALNVLLHFIFIDCKSPIAVIFSLTTAGIPFMLQHLTFVAPSYFQLCSVPAANQLTLIPTVPSPYLQGPCGGQSADRA